MCLILFAFNKHSKYKLIVAANRDEFYKRPTAPAHWWEDSPHILAGKDLQAGGTWMGITKTGKFAAITNYRGKKVPFKRKNAPSRGKLVSEYLDSTVTPEDYAHTLRETGHNYNGFNLLFGDSAQLLYYSNVFENTMALTLEPGIYGLSNDILDTPWPKVVKGKASLKSILESGHTKDSRLAEELFSVLNDRSFSGYKDLPDTGIGRIKERMLSPLFIRTPLYGTRSSTVVLTGYNGNVFFEERNVKPSNETVFRFVRSDSDGN